MRTVGMVELSVFERITPLVSGYLEAYARADDVLTGEYVYRTYTTSIKTPAAEVTRHVLDLDADIYTFSCYVWNMGLVRQVLAALRAARPHVPVLLGGPQVMHHADQQLSSTDTATAVCNGEGEGIFAAYLRELTETTPDLTKVPGLSVRRDGQLITTPAPPRLASLDEIPSPYLTGLFDDEYTIGLLETNRGCPYHCGFCYWGAATNDRVYRFDEERVRDEITWMGRNNVFFVYLVDANWGMLGRDIELSQHMADCTREFGMPKTVYFSAAKNKPQAVTKITEIFQNAGLVASQPVSIQSMEPRVLDLVARSNIKLSAFAALQQDLREKRVSSFIELIWPLPGETLDSFKSGIGQLCDNGAQTVIAYSHLLLNNTPIYHNRDRLGLTTRPAGGDVADARIVIATREASTADFADGMRFFYAVHALHNTRSLRTVAEYLVGAGVTTYAGLFSEFVDYWRSRPDDPLVRFVERSIAAADYYDLGNYGLFVHLALHQHRDVFAEQLRDFATSRDWWADPKARARFEIDTINRPYVYSNTPLDEPSGAGAAVRVLGRTGRRYTVELAGEWTEELRDAARLPAGGPGYVVDHKRLQFPNMATQTLEHNAHYCHGMIEKVENIAPVWRAVPAPAHH